METYKYICIIYILCITFIKGNTNCPVEQCECHPGQTSADLRVIDCRDKDLLQIPPFNVTNEIFAEITFSSANIQCGDTNSCSNKIVHIPNDAFNGLKVQKIDFSLNYIVSIDNGAFRGLENVLTDLILEGNDQGPVPFTPLTNLTNLKYLKLEHYNQNQILSLPQSFPNLEILIFQTLQLTYINPDAVAGNLRKLRRLEIKNNPDFTSFPTSVIRQLTNIEHVSLVQNGLTRLPTTGNAFDLNLKFAELDLSHNSIYELQSGCFDSLQDKLEYLGLHINALDASKLTPLAEATWPKLEQLILDANPLGVSGIPSNLFKNMPNLANLNLQQCGLSHIKENDFNGLTNLHNLHLSGNHITQIDSGAFLKTPNLKELYLDSNIPHSGKLNLTAQSVIGLENLHKIDLINSNVEPTQIWNAVQAMTGIQHLMLRENELSNIPDFAFMANSKLQILDLENNKITELTQAQIHGVSSTLTNINLKTNLITVIDKCVVQDLTNINSLYLAGNPLNCDCELIGLYDWAIQKANSDTFRFTFQAKCNTPAQLQGRYLIGFPGQPDLSRSDLVCSGTSQPIQCQTFTTTTIPTTTTTVTTPVVTSAPLPIINLFINGRSGNKISLSWNVANSGLVQKFFIKSERLSTAVTEATIDVQSTARQYEIAIAMTDQDYKICIEAQTTDGRKTLPTCKNSNAPIRPSVGPTESPQTGLTIGEKAAIGAGVAIIIILIILIIVFLVCYQRKDKLKGNSLPPVHFTAATRPAVGYDSKRFSKPKKVTHVNGGTKVNGDLIISTISSGSPNSRHSDGSYQYLNEDQMINIQPHLTPMKGANGTTKDSLGYQNQQKRSDISGRLKDANLQQKHQDVNGSLKDPNFKTTASEKPGHSRYDKTPGQGHGKGHAPKQPPQYVNEPQRLSDGVYTNDIKDRPLPKPRIKHYENNNSSGFLNHGFDLDSPTHENKTESTYSEIDPNLESRI